MFEMLFEKLSTHFSPFVLIFMLKNMHRTNEIHNFGAFINQSEYECSFYCREPGF
jgi:hypothetical protein